MIARRRRAPRAERTTDVTRVRGIAIAAAVTAVAGAVAVVALTGADARRGSPGPLPRPHALAGVTCDACHGGATIAQGCVTCHGAHPSARAPHRELATRGTLACTDCHNGHAGGGVALLADGRALRYGAGDERDAGTTAFRAQAAIYVPVIAAATCGRCHDAASPRDPIARCVLAGQTVCFDEHHPVRDADSAIAARAAAWDAAREVVAREPGAPSPPSRRGAPWSWLALAIAAGGLVWIGRRRVASPARAAAAPTPAPPAILRLPVIDTSTCLGCYACVDACPYDVLEIRKYVAVVARPADCCGLILCEQKCPNGSLALEFADRAPGPALRESLESTTVPGLYLAGDVGGQPLIRNAINQGALAVRAIAESLPRHDAPLDLLIVGAGPAGLAAALEAHARGLRYVALEQATIADSIRSFPRGKLVIDPDLPNASALWLAEATKEELLARWTRTVREVKPAIREGCRVTRIAPGGSAERSESGGGGRGWLAPDGERSEPYPGFTVETAAGESFRAARVIVAIGRRGTPRQLAVDVPPAFADHVHYSLADARSFAGRRVLVVGLGDVAMEAAVALASQPGTEVVVAARAPEFRRGKARNIAEMRRRVASGALRVEWESEVAAVLPGRATLATPRGPREVACDSIFVLIGSIPAEDLLRGAGVLQE
jgi:thioredoxin reductase